MLLSTVGLLVGCPPSEGPGFTSAREALEHVNDNVAKIEGPLYAGDATVSFSFRDSDGRTRRFVGHQATLIFEEPRDLYFDVKHSLAGSVAHLGSNDERYWLWIDAPDFRKLWWGYWADIDEGADSGLPIPPDLLLDALMMRTLPDNVPGGIRALLIEQSTDHLLFQRLKADGWPYVAREIVFDRRPPFQPVAIIDRLPDNRVLMHATVEKYHPVENTGKEGPQTAHHYAIRWPLHETEMDLKLRRVRYRTKDTPFSTFPDYWEGDVEQLNAPTSRESAPPPAERTP